ncbi:SIMPL domain-containing protein [Candidatus Wolfebacteria bacterium]|nr:SIMPL domain-containing protein [Candidatus Wolfebacteria bacterium]
MLDDHIRVKNLSVAGFLGVLALVIAWSAFWGPVRRLSDSFSPARVFTVSAEGKVTAAPDTAQISFSVVTEGREPENVAEENNKKMNRAIAFLKESGVREGDMRTTQYHLASRYSIEPPPIYPDGRPVPNARKPILLGYTLTQSVSVKIRNIDKEISRVGEIIGGLPGTGVNQTGEISFIVDDEERYLADARMLAIDKAKAKAEKMAKASGIRMGRIITMGEIMGIVPFYASSYSGLRSAMESSAPSIEPGTRELTVQVSITYEIR